MRLARFPRRRYTPGFTPLERLDRLSEALGGPEIWIKRDDLLGLAAGGNKTRKLEFLVADALKHGADTLVTVGAPQSNHCRLTLAAAAKEGLQCRLVIEERVPGTYAADASGNNFLFDLMGVEKISVIPLGADMAGAMQAEAAEVAALGRKAYIIPGGGSNPLGALGYVACAEEVEAQSFELGVAFDQMVCASGSAGTHAGLLVGLTMASSGIPLTGINVRRPRDEQEGNVHKLAVETANLLEVDTPARDSVVCLDEWVGGGYSIPTDGMVEAVRLLARLEGVLLDPVYTGKAMDGLISLVRRGHFRRDEKVVFLHTGGSPGLFAYEDVLRTGQRNKTVGVIGGMGPAATLEFQARLLAATPAARDQDHLRLIIDCNPGIPDRNAAIAGAGPSPGPVLAAMARGLEAAGAAFLVMPCNTAHAFAADIRAAVSIPLISLIEAAADEAARVAPGAAVGVLAVDGTRAAGLYETALAQRGLTPLMLDADDQARFMKGIYAIKAGDTGPAVRADIAASARSLSARGATAVIAACTELPLVLGPADLDVPLIDSTAVLVAATLDHALGA